MKQLSYLFTILTVFALSACGGGGDAATTGGDEAATAGDKAAKSAEPAGLEVNLADRGIPISFTAPAGAEITVGMGAMEIGGEKYHCYEVKKGSFNMQVGSWDSPSEETIAELVANAKTDAMEDDDFEKFELQEENGIIWKIVTEYGEDWNFRYFAMKGDRAVEFTTALNMSEYTLADAQAMFNAAKGAK